MIKTKDGMTVTVEEKAAPRRKGNYKEIPTTDLLALTPLVRLAFPEQGMGVGEAERFVPLERGTWEEIPTICARLARKGWSSGDVAENIISRIPEVKASLGLGSASVDEVKDSVNRFAAFLAQFYPGNQTRKRRPK